MLLTLHERLRNSIEQDKIELVTLTTIISVVGNWSNSYGQLKTIFLIIGFSEFFGGRGLGLDSRLFELGPSPWYYYQAKGGGLVIT